MSNDILGHDCDGKPLRAGDKAIFVEQPSNRCFAERSPITRQVVVTGLPGSNSLKPAAKSAFGRVEVDVADHDGDFMTCHPGKLRKVAEADRLCDSAMTEEEQEIPAEDWGVCADADEDMVNHPPHYQLREGYEVYDLRQDLARKAQAANVPHDQYSDWDRALEYLLRMWDKNGLEDAKKGAWYIGKLIGKLEASEIRAKELEG